MVLAGGRGVVRARGVREGEGDRGAMRGRRRKGRAMVARFGEPAHGRKRKREDAQGAIANSLYLCAHQPCARMPSAASSRTMRAGGPQLRNLHLDDFVRRQELRREEKRIRKMPLARITRMFVKRAASFRTSLARCGGIGKAARGVFVDLP